MSKELVNKVRSLRSAMDAGNIALDARETIQSNFVAAIIAAKLEVPSSIIEGNPKIHFMNVHMGIVNQMIGEINEEVVINVDFVQASTYNIWKERYELVHYPIKGVVMALKNLLPAESSELNFLVQMIGVR